MQHSTMKDEEPLSLVSVLAAPTDGSYIVFPSLPVKWGPSSPSMRSQVVTNNMLMVLQLV